jgi:cytochrome P450
MNDTTAEPVRLTGFAALRWGLRFAGDPLTTTRRAFDRWGPFVILAEGLPLIRSARTVMLGVPLIWTAGAEFHREMLSAPEKWRGVSLLPGGPRGSAARRMSSGLTRLTGSRHAHYRKLMLSPLSKPSVQAMTERMAQLAAVETALWPIGETIDLWDYAGRIMRSFALELLFGGDSEQTRLIAKLVSRLMERKWDWSAIAFPVNLPMAPYGQVVRDSEVLERLILEWVAAKRGSVDNHELASIIVNTRDVDGNRPDDAAIVGQLASLFAAAFEAGHSALIWTLLLLTQHPRITADLLDELHEKLGGLSQSLDRAGDLPYLDAVVKESLRVLPPVPLQIRVAQSDTTIAGHPVPKGTRVMLNSFLTNRMPELFPQGNAFRPERWSTIAPSMFEFPVFSGGPHSCPGYWFGSTAVKVALAAILARYQIELSAKARIDYRVQPTFRPRRGVPVVLRRREGHKSAARPITGNIRNLVDFPQ